MDVLLSPCQYYLRERRAEVMHPTASSCLSHIQRRSNPKAARLLSPRFALSRSSSSLTTSSSTPSILTTVRKEHRTLTTSHSFNMPSMPKNILKEGQKEEIKVSLNSLLLFPPLSPLTLDSLYSSKTRPSSPTASTSTANGSRNPTTAPHSQCTTRPPAPN